MTGAALRRTACLAAFSVLMLLDFCHAFLSVKRQRTGYQPEASLLVPTGAQRTIRSGLQAASGNGNEEEEDIDVEIERKRLESLLGTTQTDSSQSNDKLLSLPLSEWKKELKTKAPLLTSIGRERLETEITLLESLAESDDAIPELWSLWYNARGPEAEKDLMKTEALVGAGQPAAWEEAEKLLKELIAREGIHWAEPVNRLATLMYLQSRHQESKELCEIVLALKPWHFGALSGMVMVHQGLQDQEGMLDYARQQMPPLPKKGEEEKQLVDPSIETRQMWVDRMLDRARAMLLGLEMGLEESFLDLDKEGKADERSNIYASSDDKIQETDSIGSTSAPPTTSEEDEDAWQ